MYDIEKYYQAVSVQDAVRALSEDEKAVVISGGSDVLIQIREGRLAGCSLVKAAKAAGTLAGTVSPGLEYTPRSRMRALGLLPSFSFITRVMVPRWRMA